MRAYPVSRTSTSPAAKPWIGQNEMRRIRLCRASEAAAGADQARCGRGSRGALLFDNEGDLRVLGRQTATPGAVSRGDGLAPIAAKRRARPARL